MYWLFHLRDRAHSVDPDNRESGAAFIILASRKPDAAKISGGFLTGPLVAPGEYSLPLVS
jgi:hypothetical protein